MVPLKSRHKISAVLTVDVVGYSRLMELDEDDTHGRLMQLRAEVLDPTIAAYAGRVIKNTGDGVLAAFDAAEDAARCAIAMQEQLIECATRFPPERRIVARMAINHCDTIVEADDIYGDGVNIAARLQAYAEPGDVIMPAPVAARLAAELAGYTTFDMGDLYLKNINRPIRAVGLRIGSLRNLTTPAPLRAADERPSIAVLPFRKQESNPADAYLADGIVEEITHALAGLKELFVISRTSTLRYAAESIDAAAIGRELGVKYILYGSVSRAGDRLRIGTELSDVETRRIICSDRYDGELGDLFDLQEKIAVAAMKSIAPHVMEWELRRVIRKHPESLTAYDLVLQALEYLYRMDYESHSRARGLLQQAIALDPGYAPAYTYTAYWHIFRVGEGWSTDPDADAEEAARVARAAIEREGNDALALAIFGHVQSFLLRDFNAADAVLNRAIDVGPNCAVAWAMSSVTRGYLGDGANAVARAEHGLRLSPLDAHVFWHEGVLAQAHYINGDYQAAVAWARRATAHNPSTMFSLRVLAASLAALGLQLDSRRVARELLRRQPKFRLSTYAPSCPFTGATLDAWIDRLRLAGLPE
jgi:adenylate cyclase